MTRAAPALALEWQSYWLLPHEPSTPLLFFFFNDTATTEIYTLSLHDALPISAGVHRVVLVTSAMVYGALEDNDVPLAEEAPLRATAEATCVGDLLEIERLGRRAPRAHPGLNVTVVRPTVLVGGTDTALTRYFESPRLLVVAGSRPCWQFCHVEDLVSALEYAVLEKVDGELTVGCDGWLEQEEVEELSGIRRMELPS